MLSTKGIEHLKFPLPTAVQPLRIRPTVTNHLSLRMTIGITSCNYGTLS